MPPKRPIAAATTSAAECTKTARIAAAAGAGEIIASRDTLEAAGNAFRVLDERSLELKGLAEPVKVATVDWSDG